jgi:hypothetical protein
MHQDAPTLDFGVRHATIGATHLDLTDEETPALIRELHDIVESDRYPFSPRIRTPRVILAKLRPETASEPLPPRRSVRHREQPQREGVGAVMKFT